MPWGRFIVLPTWCGKGPSSHETDAIATPNLNNLPGEILINIAEYLQPQIFPASDPERTYTSTDGMTCQYYPWAPHFPASYRHHHDEVKGFRRRHADRKTLVHLRRGGRPKPCRDVINFSLTSRRIFFALYVSRYRAPVAVGNRSVRSLLANIAKRNHLQDFVREMTVVYDMFEQSSCESWNWFPLLRLKNRINADALELKILRSLDVALEPWVKEPKHVVEWCRLLPKLPALERISFKHFRGLELHLPHLPRITEAHFYNCAPWNSSWRATRPQAESILKKLPALRSLAAYNSLHASWGVDDCKSQHFDHIAPHLEFLGWSHKHSGACLNSFLEAEVPLSRLTMVKRLSLCWYHFVSYVLRTGDGPERDDFMPSLETFELHTVFKIPSWYLGGRSQGVSSPQLASVLGWIETRCHTESNRIRIVDLRAVGLTPKGKPPLTDVGEVLTDYQKRLRRLGVELLVADDHVCG
ncbi:hypothetical protein CGLO_00682 [Colletotrichum gloeosporioides Cg-14]|uniref:F-box domain-containing protein n=1 Tax=Colletotrichum gloeosporioides (strain Cg-14) TaxID=1237896 RepID=T0M6C7_COLGC|nr:hypothetical protein CGLO_00682 [Colletotrichum gloeosporioides Cg-14]